MDGEALVSELKRTVSELTALTEIGKRLTQNLELGDVLSSIMEQVGSVLSTRNWSLLLLGEDGAELAFEVAVGAGSERLRGMKVKLGEGIAGWCAMQQQPLLVPDVAKDPRFAPSFDRVSDFKTGSIVAAPLTCRGRTLGVMELVAGEGQRPFGEADLKVLCTFADFAAIAIDNARNYTRVQELTVSDDCTHLNNARYLQRTLPLELARAQRHGHAVAMVFFDLDHFKDVNDKHGHLAGGRVLFEIGEILLSLVRRTDIAVRFGGDEFVVVLPETDVAGAKIFTERLRQRINDCSFLKSDGLDIRQTASFGVACYPEDGKTADELLRRSDQTMYLVKQGTRNGILFASEAAR